MQLIFKGFQLALISGQLGLHLFQSHLCLKSGLFEGFLGFLLLYPLGLQLCVYSLQLFSPFCNGLRQSALDLPPLCRGRFQPEFHLAPLFALSVKPRPQLFNDGFSGKPCLLQALFGLFVLGKLFLQPLNGSFSVMSGSLQLLFGRFALGKFGLQLLRDCL